MEKKEIKRIAIFTSGGDAPGMNAAVSAVTRSAIASNIEVFGIYQGYQGMIDNDFKKLGIADVHDIIQKGGTVLKTARSMDFMKKEGRQKAFQNLQKNKIDGVIVIGGDGSFKGATIFSQEFDIPFIGIPGTIDNDISGTDYTIGYDTALNTVVEAIDKIKDTASSQDRLFFIEAMGHEAGLLALESGIASGAEVILIPEILDQENELDNFINNRIKDKNTSGIVVVSEGDELGGALEIAKKVQSEYPHIEVRVSILGYIQRGGNPTAKDRVEAIRMGVAAFKCLLAGKKNIMVGLKKHDIIEVPFSKTAKAFRSINSELLDIQKTLNNYSVTT